MRNRTEKEEFVRTIFLGFPDHFSSLKDTLLTLQLKNGDTGDVKKVVEVDFNDDEISLSLEGGGKESLGYSHLDVQTVARNYMTNLLSSEKED